MLRYAPGSPRPVTLLERPRSRRLLFAALYFTEGAPIGFLWWALPAILRERGGPVEAIGALLAVLVLPWGFKFLWAPLIDVLATSPRGLAAWIAAAQGAMALSLLPLIGLDPERLFGAVALLLVLHALAAATQDVAIDALAIRSTPPGERGSLNGWMQAGMLLGRGLFGGGALIALEQVGDRALILALVGLSLASATAVLVLGRGFPGPAPGRARRSPDARWRAFGGRLKRVLAARSTRLGLAFALLGGAGFEAVGGLASPFLVDSGFGTAEIGRFFALPAVACTGAGALLGGRLADRLGHRRAVVGAAVAVAACIGLLSAAASGGLPHAWLWGALAALYVGIGGFTVASYALFMDLCDPALGGTQFSAFMGATNLCESWSVLAAGYLTAALGYPTAFAALAAAALLALPDLRRVEGGARGPAPPPGDPH